jgi:hypothetical protein
MCLSIVDTASKICQDIKPVLLLDTCALLDIVRTPVRENIPAEIVSSAIKLISTRQEVWLIACEVIDTEWKKHIDEVAISTANDIKNLHKRVKLFEDVVNCSPISPKWSYVKPVTSYDLEIELRKISVNFLNSLEFIKPDADCTVKASTRLINAVAPASKGKDEFKDCLIIEHYLKLSSQLRKMGFSEKIIFVSSNKNDFGNPYGLAPPLDSEFSIVGLDYVSNLHDAAKKVMQ